MSEHGSKTLTVSFVWATFGISLARPKWFPVAIGDHGRNLVISLWPRDNANIKNSECKNPLEKFSPRFFRIKMESSSLIIFQRAKLSPHGITHLCWWSPGTCNPEETGLPGLSMSSEPTLFSRLALSEYHLFPGLKTQLKGHHFLSNTEVTAAVETWLAGQPSDFFFEWLAKVRAMC